MEKFILEPQSVEVDLELYKTTTLFLSVEIKIEGDNFKYFGIPVVTFDSSTKNVDSNGRYELIKEAEDSIEKFVVTLGTYGVIDMKGTGKLPKVNYTVAVEAGHDTIYKKDCINKEITEAQFMVQLTLKFVKK